MGTENRGGKKGQQPPGMGHMPSFRNMEILLPAEELNRHQRRAIAKQLRNGVRCQFN